MTGAVWHDWYTRKSDDRVVLKGTQCEKCGELFFPGQSLCLRCKHGGMKQIELDQIGKISHFTTVHRGPGGFECPYVCGYATFNEKVSVFGIIKPEGDEIRIGDPVMCVEDTIYRDGEVPIKGYVFKKWKE